MHQAAYEALGLDGWRFQRLPVPPELFEETVRALPRAGFAGANVTIPHKEAALGLADTATDRAREIGAAHTRTFGDAGTIDADNTDAPGLLDALGDVPSSAVVLGAGGSARAAAWALARAGARVTVFNRTPERAQRLAADLGVAATTEPPTGGECLVNCTSVGLDDPAATPLEDPSGFAVVADLVYREGGTELLRRAGAAGARTVDGLEVLVRQGALSFERWTGLQAPLGAMRRSARGQS